MSTPQRHLVWLRSYDLRLHDNEALFRASASGQSIGVVYIHDETNERPLGGAAKWWLHHSLIKLEKALHQKGIHLQILQGNAEQLMVELVTKNAITHVHWLRRYTPQGINCDKAIKASLKAKGITATSYQGSLLYEPWTITNQAGLPFKVFTPFWKTCLASGEPRAPYPAPPATHSFLCQDTIAIDALRLLPKAPDWSGGLQQTWEPGEDGANKQLSMFLTRIERYAGGRDRPDEENTSRLSPYLRFGNISPHQVWHAIRHEAERRNLSADKFLSEIGWREFAHHLLFQHPHLHSRNFQPKFDAFEWASNEHHLHAWQKGKTGYPIVDAGMRQLWQTGWMHNRVRMIVGSFLVKHLLLDWRHGEAWFWDTLVDACPANNPASWQWVAGTGADAAPYFRVFNPVIQGEKFDPNGHYVKTYIPELKNIPAKDIHKPWEMPPTLMKARHLELGADYPEPLVDHSKAREKALAAFSAIKEYTNTQL